MKITGSYKFKQDNNTIYESSNLITMQGKGFFMNRCVNNEFNIIDTISLGKGTSTPKSSDRSLGKPYTSKKCEYTVDLKNNGLRFIARFEPSEVVGCTEIGLSADGLLLTHDVFDEINNEIISNDNSSTVNIEYTLNFDLGSARTDLKEATPKGSGKYYLYEPATVIGVSDSNGDGYIRKNSVDELVNHSYYYDFTSKNLYIMNTVKPSSILIFTK